MAMDDYHRGEDRAAQLRREFGWRERLLYLFCVPPREAFQGADHDAPTGRWSMENALKILRAEFAGFDGIIRNARVLDYGCGDGFQSIAMADSGAREVIGVDLEEQRLTIARRLAGERANVSFGQNMPRQFDLAVSLNAFEHFPMPLENLREMRDALRPGGLLLITFSPPWFSPWGAHMNFFCRLPWVHLIFSEATVHRVRALYRETGTMTYGPELNRMTLAKFERIIAESGMRVRSVKYTAV